MGLVRLYELKEIAAILKKSENSSAGDAGSGHAEGLHVINPVGPKRSHTTEQDLLERATWGQKKIVGAFDDSQAEAVHRAINSQAGQNALQYLNSKSVAHIFAEIIIRPQDLKMTMVRAEKQVLMGMVIFENSGIERSTVKAVAMKLMKNKADNSLHIRTAFPLAEAPMRNGAEWSHCMITYENGNTLDQDLPA